MIGDEPAAGTRVVPSRVAWLFDAGLAAFAASTGALLAFAYVQGDTLAPFALVGRRVARDIVFSTGGDAAIGLAVHFGQSIALGAAMALLLGAERISSRVRSALIVVLCWQLVAFVPWIAVVRADIAIGLTPLPRVGLAALLTAALALAPRRMRI